MTCRVSSLGTAILLMAVHAAGCRGVPDYPNTSFAGKSAAVVFVANTSPVHFSDLIVIYQRPRFEGCFGPFMNGELGRRVIQEQIESGRAYTSEAEWVLCFQEPLQPSTAGPRTTQPTIDQLVVTFADMVEGKYVDVLANAVNDNWAGASAGNNFCELDAQGRPRAHLGYRTVAEWDALFRSSAASKYDDSTVTVAETVRDGSVMRRVATFGDTRKGLLKKLDRQGGLAELVRQVYAVFDKTAREGGHTDVRLAAINLGAHGSNAALVNAPGRRFVAAVEAFILLPVQWDGRQTFMTRVTRAVARQISRGRYAVPNASTISVSMVLRERPATSASGSTSSARAKGAGLAGAAADGSIGPWLMPSPFCPHRQVSAHFRGSSHASSVYLDSGSPRQPLHIRTNRSGGAGTGCDCAVQGGDPQLQ